MKQVKWINAIVLSSTIFAFSGIASAHVTVSPKESTTGAYEKYTFRVPVEKSANTTGLRIEFPAGEQLSTVEPVQGWDYSIENDANGYAKAITWKATAGGIKPHEFTEFSIIAVNPKTASSLTWKAYQTYADGPVVEWTGDSNAQTPAPVTQIVASTSSAAAPSSNQAAAAPAQSAAPQTASPVQNNLPLIFSAAALLISIISLFRKKA